MTIHGAENDAGIQMILRHSLSSCPPNPGGRKRGPGPRDGGESGFTLLEMLVTAVIFGILMAAFASYLPKIQAYFRRLQLQQQMQSESAAAMDTMVRFLRSGKASTVAICSCNGEECAKPALCTASAPNSQIDFYTQDGHFRSFYWEKDAAGLTTLKQFDDPRNTGAPPTISILAHNVGGVLFSGDFRDLSIVSVSLFMSAPLDASGDPSHVMNVNLPTQSVRMITTQ